jgi:2-amino-4-hydroxy-6-hydroxymethyldihydropteridine diphosphokinase
MKSNAYLLLGSNVERERCYPEAVRLIASFGEVLAVSPVYETAPVGMEGADDFFNGALLLRTPLEPEDLKARLRAEVEGPLGRLRRAGEKFVPRTMDVDIALWGDLVGEIGGSPVPDPDILKHLHVARPLADIAPELPHPVTGEPLGEIARALEKAATRSGGTVAPLPRVRADIILGD